jgi:hypothetical protein
MLDQQGARLMMPFASMAGRNALAPPIIIASGTGSPPTPASKGAQVGDLIFFNVYGAVGGSSVVQLADTVYAFITSANINTTFTGNIGGWFILRGVKGARAAVTNSSAANAGFVKSPNYIGLISMSVTSQIGIVSALAGAIAMTQQSFVNYSSNSVYKYYHSLFRPNQPSDYVDLTPFKINLGGSSTSTPSQVIELLG